MHRKNTAASGKLIKAVYVSYVYVIIRIHKYTVWQNARVLKVTAGGIHN